MMTRDVPDPPPYFAIPTQPLRTSSPRSSLDLSTTFETGCSGGIFRESSCPDRVSDLTKALDTRLTIGHPFCTIKPSLITTPMPPPPPPPARALTPTEVTPTGSPGPHLHLLAHQLQVLEEQRLILQAEMRELQLSPAGHEDQLDRLLARFTFLRLQADDLARRATYSIDKRISIASTDSLEESFMGRSRRENSSTFSELFMTSMESNSDQSPSYNGGISSGNSNGPSRQRPISVQVSASMPEDGGMRTKTDTKRISDSVSFPCRPNYFPEWDTVKEVPKSRSSDDDDEEEVEDENSRKNLREELVAQGHPVTLYRDEVYLTSEACRGFLDKMGGRFKTWRRRWFVFDRESAELRYYLNTNENRLKGAIPFSTMTEVYVNSNPPRHYRSPNRRLTFCLATSARTFYFVANSSEVMRMWIEVLLTAILNKSMTTERPT